MYWFGFLVSFLICNILEGAQIIVANSDGSTHSFSSTEYAVVKRSTLKRYRALERRMAQKSAPLCEPVQCPPQTVERVEREDKKNRIYLYGGVNQGAITLTDVRDNQGGRDIEIYQRSVGVAGLGYSRKVYSDVSLNLSFIYQNIYLGGIGYDF